MELPKKIIDKVLDDISFTEEEIKLIKKRIIELVKNRNEEIICILLDKMMPDAK